jgi:hypothetical protein
MQAAIVQRTSLEVVRIGVLDVPDLDISEGHHRRPRIIRPDQISLEIRDDEPDRVELSGPIVLRSGQLSIETRGNYVWTYSGFRLNNISTAPEWIHKLIQAVIDGETSWSA